MGQPPRAASRSDEEMPASSSRSTTTVAGSTSTSPPGGWASATSGNGSSPSADCSRWRARREKGQGSARRSRRDRSPAGVGTIDPYPAASEMRILVHMFARYFVELPISPEEVERALSRDPRLWLPGLAERAHHRGD